MKFTLKIEPEAYTDIQNAISYYNVKKEGLGKRFHKVIKHSFETLRINPFYQVRYQNKRCFNIKPFPFLIHFTVNEQSKSITIIAIIHTSINPSKWYKE